MPLDPTHFVPKGPVDSLDIRQFYDLFTGVMVDQPITFRNATSMGGDQGVATVPVKVYGAIGQNTNLIDLYPDRTSAQPGFGFSAVGTFAWGPGGTAPQDTFMSRIAVQHGHVADTPGLLISPQLEVQGSFLVDNDIVVDHLEGNTGSGLSPGIRFGNTISEGISSQRTSAGGNNRYGLDFWTGGSKRMTITNGGGVAINPGGLTVTGDIYSHYLHTNDGSNGIVMADTGSLYLRSASTTVVVDGAGGVLTGLVTFNQNNYFWRGIAGVAAIETNGNLQIDGGVIYMEASRQVTIQYRPDIGAVYVPYGNGIYTTTVLANRHDWESGRNVYMVWDGANVTMNMAGAWGFRAPTVGANTVIVGPVSVTATATTLHPINADINLDPPRVLSLGSALVSPGTNIGKSADTVYLSAHAYVFFDLGVGHVITCQQVIQTSDPNLKANATVVSDVDCMARIRGNVPVYTYQLSPPTPVPPGPPQPTPTVNDIGMMATDVFAVAPEFAALDANSAPVGVNYANMSAMLWGALRNLDARCVAKGI